MVVFGDGTTSWILELWLAVRWAVGRAERESPMLKLLRMPKSKLFAASDARLKASKSGFWSSGITRGDAAAVERTCEVGGLQFERAC